MSLASQKRMASKILKVGINRVWIDPDEADKVLSAITRNEIRKLIHEGIIGAKPKSGISRGRVRGKQLKRRVGRRRGPGSRKGTRRSGSTWTRRIRAVREQLRELRDKRMIERGIYRRLFQMARGGAFRDSTHVTEYVEAHRLVKRR